MNFRSVFLMMSIASALSGCGGGGTTDTPAAVANIQIIGTAATGKAIAGAGIDAKCQTVTAHATTSADGTYSMTVPGGKLPCILEVNNPADGSKLHTLVAGSGNNLVVNISQLTEMVTARVLRDEPAVFFAAFNAGTAANNITAANIKAAQSDIGTILNGVVDTGFLADFIATPLKAATQDDANAGDAQDKLLDALHLKMNSAQLSQVVGVLAHTASITEIKQAVANVTAAPPVARAGGAQSVLTGTTVSLDGSASSADIAAPLSYAWTLISKPEGSAAVLQAAMTSKPSFAPDLAGLYVAAVVVNDGRVNSAAATTTITASIANAAPTASAGSTQNVVRWDRVTLDGSASSDANSDALTYHWTLASKPTLSDAELSSAGAMRPTFIPDAVGTYTANLVVSDGKLSSSAAAVVITVAASPTVTPLMSFSISGGRATNSAAAASFRRPAASYPSFWDFCGVAKCIGTNAQTPPADGKTLTRMYSSGTAGLFTVEMNVNGGADYPMDLFVQAFPATPASGGLAKSSIQIRANAAKLAQIPEGEAGGSQIAVSTYESASKGGTGASTYTISSTVDTLALPQGWKAAAETLVEVTLSSSWTDENGRLAFGTIAIFSKTYRGTFSDNIVLSHRLEDYPTLHGQYAEYVITAAPRLVFKR